MKKIIIAALLIVLAALPASAGLFGGASGPKYGTKGAIPNAEPVEYRGLKVTDNGVNIIIINRSTDKTVKFSAALAFVSNRRKEIGDVFIEEMTLAPKEQKQLTNLYLKGGDAKSCRDAEKLNWTVYTLEVK